MMDKFDKLREATLKRGNNSYYIEKLAKQRSRIAGLESALEKYGEHRPECQKLYPHDTRKCTCGYTQTTQL